MGTTFVGASLFDQRINAETSRRLKFAVISYVLLMILLVTSFSICGAAEGSELTDLFQTSAFTGSWEVFSKFNWLGKVLNFLISMFCLIGLMMIAFRLIITLLYKSNEALFDRVYDLKQGQDGLFAIKDQFTNMFKGGGNYGVGLDAIVGFVLSLLPNIKAYSDYNPEKMLYNLAEDDTMTTYVLKISLPTIFAIFFFAIGFNGTLLQGYGSVANAMAKGAKKLVEVDLANSVEKVMSAGAYYQFSFDTSNDLGKLQSSTAKNLYNKLLLRMDSITTENMQSVGSKVQTKIENTISVENLNLANTDNGKKIVKEQPETYKRAKNYTVSVFINSNAEANGSNDHTCTLGDLGVTQAKEGTADTVHILIKKKADADETDYFQVKGAEPQSSAAATPEVVNGTGGK